MHSRHRTVHMNDCVIIVSLMQISAAFQHNDGDRHDWKNAYRWSRCAADTLPITDPQYGVASYVTAFVLVFGMNAVQINDYEAITYMERAREMNVQPANNLLAHMLYNGKGGFIADKIDAGRHPYVMSLIVVYFSSL
jgi:TPR repeat protein